MDVSGLRGGPRVRANMISDFEWGMVEIYRGGILAIRSAYQRRKRVGGKPIGSKQKSTILAHVTAALPEAVNTAAQQAIEHAPYWRL